jgi:cobalt-zinc-cadmium resistance protein CzcA
MLEKLIRFSLKQRYIVLSVAVLVIGAGVWAWLTLKIEAYPDVADTQVEIITTYDGRPAEEVEQQVTIPIERAVNAVPHVINRRSRTIFGLSVIDLTFDENTNDYFARQQVLEKLQDASLPDGVQPSLGPLSGPVDEILRYVIEGKGSRRWNCENCKIGSSRRKFFKPQAQQTSKTLVALCGGSMWL